MFELTDLFAFGLGFDIAGGYLLARGLIRSPRSIRRRATWGGLYPGGLIDDVEDWANATVGLVALLFGFVIQAAAYALVLGFGETANASAGRAAVAVLAVVIPAVATVLAARLTHRGRVDRHLVRVAREDIKANTTQEVPDTEMLTRVAEHQHRERLPNESDAAYVGRIFGVTVSEPDGSPIA